MKKFAVALLFCGVTAFATPIDYTTSGYFGAAPGSTSITNGGATISFAGVATTQNADPGGTFTNVGTFTITGGTGVFSDVFTLIIDQTDPAGSAMTSSPISGTIKSNGSTISLNFVPSTLDINGALWIFGTTNLNQPSVNGGVTTVQEYVVSPEPTTLGLLGASLVGLGIAFRRRRAA